MAAEPAPARSFWSGTITFGLVSIPVDLYTAVRSQRVSMRMLSPDGHPLVRRYVCSADQKLLDSDEIVRGHPWDDDYVVVTDEELASLEPRRSRDIELRRFVPRAQLDVMHLQRVYVLAPSGESTKAYHLLAHTMERGGQVGIATFVMRGREYLAGIFAEGGLLRAAILRFAQEVRSPEDIGLPAVPKVPAKARKAMGAVLRKLERAQLDASKLVNEDGQKLLDLAERKHAASEDVVEVPQEMLERENEGEEITDLMSLIKERLDAGDGGTRARRPEPNDDLEDLSKKDLYERAKDLDIPNRSGMTKEQLTEAIRSATH